MWRHRCAVGLKKKFYLRSGSQRHRHFAGFFNVPVLHRHGSTFLYRDSDTPPHLVAFYDTHEIRWTHSRLNPGPSRGQIKYKENRLDIVYLKCVRKTRTRDWPQYLLNQAYDIWRWSCQIKEANPPPPPVRARGLSRECAPPYPQRDRKRRLNGAVCRNHRIKRVVPCRC